MLLKEEYRREIYNLEALQHYVREYVTEYNSQQILSRGKTEEEFQKAKTRKEKLSEYLNECSYGDIKAKEFVKLFIKQLITAETKDINLYLQDYPDRYKVTENNIHLFLNLRDEEALTVPLAYKIVLFAYVKRYGRSAFARMIEKFDLNRLRVDKYGDEKFYISDEDIVKVYHAEKPVLNYEDVLDILVQIIYENYKGLGVIDDLLDMDRIDEVSIGVSGLPNDMVPRSKKYQVAELPKAYDSISVRYRGNPIHLEFLSFESWDELERVNKSLVKYEQSREFSQKEGYILGFRKNGSRISAAREPFGECRAAWVRNFHIEDVSFRELVRGFNPDKPIKGWEKVDRRANMLIKGCATTAVSGGQGLGKSTAMLSLIEYVYSFYTLRLIETVFELQARRRYPGRDIFTMQETENIDEADAYNFSLRTSGDVTFIGETRTDKMITQIINTGNRGSKFTVFSFHPIEADLCPLEMANAMLRLKIYSTLKEALLAVLKTLKCCIQIAKNIETGDRYYPIYEFVPYELQIPRDFVNMKGEDRMSAFMHTCYTFFEKMTENKFYNTVPIVEFDYDSERYVVRNTVSDQLFEHLYKNVQKREERLELKKLFRPEAYIMHVLEERNLDGSLANIEKIIRDHDIDGFEDISKNARRISSLWKEGI